MAYKLRGAFKEKEKEAPSTVMYNLFYKPEVREHMKVFENNLKDTLMHEIARKNSKELAEEYSSSDASEEAIVTDIDEAGTVSSNGEGDGKA